MKISYIREMKRNYLLAEPQEEKTAEYEARMLAANRIQGLLQMKVKYRDGTLSYCYDITSKQPLSRLAEAGFLGKEEVRGLILQLYETLSRMEAYLLGDGGLLIQQEYIYVEPENFDVQWCFVPGREADFGEDLSRLLQYLLKHINHKDRECVVLAYGLYQESLKENYGIDDLVALIGENEKDITVSEENTEKIASEERLLSAEKNIAPASKKTCEPETERKKTGFPVTKQLVWFALGSVVLWGASWLFLGASSVRALWKLLADAEVLALLTILAVNLFLRRKPEKKPLPPKEEETSWQILYEEEEEEPPPEKKEELHKTEEPEEMFQTVLLSGEEESLHRLEGVKQETEDIVVSYYPFVIGKHRELADYVLNRDTVSRFHLKLDNEGDSYTATDLNSTNGTTIRGILLDANETVELKPGDEVMIADIKYIWR